MAYKYLSHINAPADIKSLSAEEMLDLSKEIRHKILSTVSKNGGHLASNLGAVELTLALHYVFDSPVDKIIWDVGHQTYTHKLLTGRYEEFDTLRQYGGLSGFPKSSESIHDIFEVGHSSTSISVAIGQEVARNLKKQKGYTVCVIGDGAMTAGMAYEALNHISELQSNIILVLNDNSMSISKNTGGLSKHLDALRTAKSYNKIKNNLKRIFKKEAGPKNAVYRFLVKFRDIIKFLFLGRIFFEELGIKYLGPIDGHNISELITEFQNSKNLNRPVILHVTTQKGKGYLPAETWPERYHGVGSFDIEKGVVQSESNSFSHVLGEILQEEAKDELDLVAITAAMCSGTGLEKFREAYPQRFFDVGIAEQHGVTFAAGLANGGLKPVFAVYSTFLQRAYDQIVHDVCLENRSVIFAIDRAGITGADGETHQGVFDIAFLRHIPNMIIMSPWGKKEFRDMIRFGLNHGGPIAIRYPKGKCSTEFDAFSGEIHVGEPITVVQGKDICILALGKENDLATALCEALKAYHLSATHVNLRFVKPLSLSYLEEAIAGHDLWISLEDGCYEGGLGQMLQAKLQTTVPGLVFAYPDAFIPHGRVDELRSALHHTKEEILNQILGKIGGKDNA